MKKIFEYLFYTFILVLTFSVFSCDPASGELKSGVRLYLDEDQTSAWYCDEFSEGTAYFDLTITVDKVIDPINQTTELHFVQTYAIDNNFKGGKKFEIDFPEKGAFAITVLMTARSCMNCCRDKCESSTTKKGKPVLRDLKTFKEHPGKGMMIDMYLKLVNCNCCN